MVNWTSVKDIGYRTRSPAMKASWMSMRTSFGCTMRNSASGRSIRAKDAHSERVASPKEKEVKPVQRRRRLRCKPRRFFQPYRKGGGKGKKSGKGSSSLASKANVAEEEVEEEEAEDDALLTDKKKRKRKPQAKKKSKPQPAGSAAHEADAAVDEDGFAYSAASFPCDIATSSQEWCLKKEVQGEDDEGTSMILDTGCTKAMCSRHAYLLMRQGLSEDQVELLPGPSAFNFANGQRALASEKCRIWFSYEPPLFTDFSIIDKGKVPFLMSLPQMKDLGVSLDLRGSPQRILFHTGFLKGQGVPLHHNCAGHLTLKAKASAGNGG